MTVPSMAEMDDRTLVVILVLATVAALYFCWELTAGKGSLWRIALGVAGAVAVTVLGPVQWGWPADTSFTLGGGLMAVVVLGTRLVGLR